MLGLARQCHEDLACLDLCEETAQLDDTVVLLVGSSLPVLLCPGVERFYFLKHTYIYMILKAMRYSKLNPFVIM